MNTDKEIPQELYEEWRATGKSIFDNSIWDVNGYVRGRKDQYLKDRKEAYKIAEETWDTCEAVCGSNDINPCYVMGKKDKYLAELFNIKTTENGQKAQKENK